MVPDEPTFLFDRSGTGTGELTHVSEIIKASGIPVADSLKGDMYEELVRLTQEEADTGCCDDRRRSA